MNEDEIKKILSEDEDENVENDNTVNEVNDNVVGDDVPPVDDTHASNKVNDDVDNVGDDDPVVDEIKEKMLPQSKVNDLIGEAKLKAREKARAEHIQELLEKYGVMSEEEMDEVFGKGQQYDVLNDDYTNRNNEFVELRAENALLKSKVIPEKWEDVKLILRGKGLDVDLDNINAEIETHPEWLGKKVVAPEGEGEGTSSITVLDNEVDNKPIEKNDDEIIKKYFGV